MRIDIPEGPARLMETLEAAGYEAYAVGGCVRDALLGRSPNDWDLCTSARPEETRACFPDWPVIETGLKHGTVTVVLEGAPYEITTYRVDGAYSDGRHPDEVRFVSSLHADLARRDFTINAMAAGRDGRLVDRFGGEADLAAGIIRCVGSPGLRFQEDALRMLRALRFASVYGFQVEEATAESIHQNRELLRRVAGERIHAELGKLLLGGGVLDILNRFPDLFGVFWPELIPLAGFEQHNSYHCLDVWGHTALAVASGSPDPVVRLALLLHDVGKPLCFSRDEGGAGHFYRHAGLGAELAGRMLHRLKYDNETIRHVTALVKYHDDQIGAGDRAVRRWLNRLGEEQLRRLLQVKRADILAQSPDRAEARLKELDELGARLDRVLSERQCYSLKMLEIDGRDLLALGVPPGAEIGRILNVLLEQVIEGKRHNDREALLGEAKLQIERTKQGGGGADEQ